MKLCQGIRFLVFLALFRTISAEEQVQAGNGTIVRRYNFAGTSGGQLVRPQTSWPPSRDAALFLASNERVVLTLRLYAYARIGANVLPVAQRHAEQILKDCGLRVAWLQCPISAEQATSNRACAVPMEPNHIVIKLLPDSMSRKYGFRRSVFGFAAGSEDGSAGSQISLFYDRVFNLAYYGDVGTSFEDAQAIILGHMITHEIGHLLLGPKSHSLEGIMKFPWDERVLQDMERGRLLFTPHQQSTIRLEVKRRFERRHEAGP